MESLCTFEYCTRRTERAISFLTKCLYLRWNKRLFLFKQFKGQVNLKAWPNPASHFFSPHGFSLQWLHPISPLCWQQAQATFRWRDADKRLCLPRHSLFNLRSFAFKTRTRDRKPMQWNVAVTCINWPCTSLIRVKIDKYLWFLMNLRRPAFLDPNDSLSHSVIQWLR